VATSGYAPGFTVKATVTSHGEPSDLFLSFTVCCCLMLGGFWLSRSNVVK